MTDLGMKALPVNELQCGSPAPTQMAHMRLLNPLQLPVAARLCTFTAIKRSISWCSPVPIGS